MTLRASARRVVEAATLGLGLAGLAERANRRAVAVLAYHNIVPDGEKPDGDLSLHLPEASFRDQLDCLQENYRIVSLDDLERPGERGSSPLVAITFDDAYAGAVSAGTAELGRRALPSTVFVPAGMLGRRSFWWDRLADDDGVVEPGARDHALWSLGGDDEGVRHWMSAEGLRERELPDHALSATSDELRKATASDLVTIAAHGSGHLNFAASRGEALNRELIGAAAALEADFGSYRPWMAYPYGLYTGAVESAAASTYRMAFRVDGGLLRPGDLLARPRALPRVNVPAGLSAPGLRLRVAGLRS